MSELKSYTISQLKPYLYKKKGTHIFISAPVLHCSAGLAHAVRLGIRRAALCDF